MSSMAMRVMYWQEAFWPSIGGVQTLSAKLLPALCERGWQIVVVTRQDDPSLPARDTFQGVPIVRLPFYQALEAKDPAGIGKLLHAVVDLKREHRPNLVHISSLGPSIFFHLESVGRDAPPLLVTVHAYRYSQSPPPDSLLTRTLKAADWVTCVSTALLDEVGQVFPEAIPRSSVIYNGLQPPDLEPTPLPFEPPVILGLGRLVHSKGFDVAMEAFASTLDRFPNARLVLLGEGTARSALERQAMRLGMYESVRFVPRVAPDQVFSWINRATLVLVPSRSEPFGMVALEAGLMARPVVGSDVGGLAEILVHEETGILVPTEDSDSMAEAIVSLIDRPAAAVRMGCEARKRVTETFSLERCVESYDVLYRTLLARG